jgi:DNA ligase-associated metallophosphoesterase
MEVTLGQQHFILHNSGAMYWVEENALLIADLHVGKATHFRNNGIPLPTDFLLKDLNQIESLMVERNTEKVYFLGDLFHSFSNIEHQLLENWMNEQIVRFVLIEGNHDRYAKAPDRCAVYHELELNNIVLKHEPPQEDVISIFGHLHPGIKIKGKGRMYTSLPAFYVNDKFIAMPAFGSLKGSRMYSEWIKDSRIYALTPEMLIAL